MLEPVERRNERAIDRQGVHDEPTRVLFHPLDVRLTFIGFLRTLGVSLWLEST